MVGNVDGFDLELNFEYLDTLGSFRKIKKQDDFIFTLPQTNVMNLKPKI